jgi:N-methylhydantoinase A
VPPNPGNVSAFGLLTVDVKNDYVRTAVSRHADLDPAAVEDVFADLQREAAEALAIEGFAPDEQRFLRSADLRYFGQAFEVRVPVADGVLEPEVVAAAFHDAHRALYGYDFRDDVRQQVEWVNLRVTGVGPISRPELRPLPGGGADRPTGARSVCFDPAVGYQVTPIFRRSDLSAGAVVAGPAVIEEYGSTVPLHPGFTARVDKYGNLIICAQAGR